MLSFLNTRILLSGATILAAAAVIAGAAFAFFSDTETSTGNTFAAGEIDLLVDSESHYAGLTCVGGVWVEDETGESTRPDLIGQPCSGTWTLTDLGPTHTFFNLGDLKPGDEGENTISLHVDNNDAYVCAVVNNLVDDDNGLTEPEGDDGDTTGGAGEGELSAEINFFAWDDDGDNVWETGEAPLFADPFFGPASDVLGGVSYPLFTPVAGGGVGPLLAGEDTFVGLAWCFGAMTVDTGTAALTCNGADVDNMSQTDSMTADISFYVEQSRNNDDFTCPGPDDIDPDGDGSAVGAALGDYDAPTCDVTLNPADSIQTAVDFASDGDVICLSDGTYSADTYPLRLDVDNITLAGENGPLPSAELGGGVIIDNDGVTVTGLIINDSTALSETFGVYVNTGVDNAEVSYNLIQGPGVGSGRGVINALGTTTNLVVNNNEITNWLSGVFLNDSTGMEVSYNTLEGNGVGSGNDHPVNNNIHHNVIKNNTIEGVGALVDAGESLSVNFNNIYSNGTGDDLNSYGTETVDAENNWWGDTAPADNVSGPVDFDPYAMSAYPEN